MRKEHSHWSSRIASKSLHFDIRNDPSLPVNSNTNLCVAEIAGQNFWGRWRGRRQGFTTFRVRFDHLCLSKSHSLTRSRAAALLLLTRVHSIQTESQFANQKSNRPYKKIKKTDPSRQGAVCNGGRATSHSLFSFTFLAFTAVSRTDFLNTDTFVDPRR